MSVYYTDIFQQSLVITSYIVYINKNIINRADSYKFKSSWHRSSGQILLQAQ